MQHSAEEINITVAHEDFVAAARGIPEKNA